MKGFLPHWFSNHILFLDFWSFARKILRGTPFVKVWEPLEFPFLLASDHKRMINVISGWGINILQEQKEEVHKNFQSLDGVKWKCFQSIPQERHRWAWWVCLLVKRPKELKGNS